MHKTIKGRDEAFRISVVFWKAPNTDVLEVVIAVINQDEHLSNTALLYASPVTAPG